MHSLFDFYGHVVIARCIGMHKILISNILGKTFYMNFHILWYCYGCCEKKSLRSQLMNFAPCFATCITFLISIFVSSIDDAGAPGPPS